MRGSVTQLGLVGATLAFLLIAGLNFTALNKQWDVPYVGVQKANAWAPCIYSSCLKYINGRQVSVVGCWRLPVSMPNSCSWCNRC